MTVRNFTAPGMTSELLSAFRDAGFAEMFYPGQEGVFLTKPSVCGAHPQIRKILVDDVEVFDDSECVFEILPDGNFQLYVPDCDHIEHVDHKDQREAWNKLARKAGVKLD